MEICVTQNDVIEAKEQKTLLLNVAAISELLNYSICKVSRLRHLIIGCGYLVMTRHHQMPAVIYSTPQALSPYDTVNDVTSQSDSIAAIGRRNR